MTGLIRRLRQDTRGATLAVTAVMLASGLATIALAFDLGFLFVGRAEAQRAADAGALAGASAFLNNVPASNAVAPATQLAENFATMHQISNVQVDTSEVTVTVDWPSRQVHVLVRRQQIGLWFARFFGRFVAPVAASATAEALPANQANCVAPLAIPDWWHDANGDTNGNRIWEANENWDWDDPSDYYERFNNDASANETGFGSQRRNGYGNPKYYRDQGRDMVIKAQNPNQWVVSTGWFFPVRLPCPTCSNNELSGGNDFRDAFTQCITQDVLIGGNYRKEGGVMVGPTLQGLGNLPPLDPNAAWDPNTSTVINSQYPGLTSPRIIKILLFDPTQIPGLKGGNASIVPNNIGLFFVESVQQSGGPQRPVFGRFLQYATGTTQGGGQNGSLLLQVRLVK